MGMRFALNVRSHIKVFSTYVNEVGERREERKTKHDLCVRENKRATWIKILEIRDEN